MRIRTQLVLAAAIAALLSIAVIGALVQATRQAQRGLDEQARSQDVVRQVANMLALTNELAVYGGDRVATQWHTRAAQLAAAIDEALAGSQPAEPALLELKRNLEDLPPLFDKLVEIGRQPSTELSQRRHELLMERLLAETQEVVESRHRWALVIAEAQQRNHRFYTGIVVAAPATLLLLLLSLGLLVSRRILGQLRRLEAAAIAIQNGRLDVRCASDARDELGDTARAVDAMALALQQSERRLRLITDSIPALISHIDTEERYTFVNAHFGRVGVGDRATMLGRTMREVRGDSVYAGLAPHVTRALEGHETRFETTRLEQGRPVHRQSIYVPDVDAAGTVRGFYALTLDITERKEAELRVVASQRLLVGITDHLPALVAYIDTDERYRFANSNYGSWLGLDPKVMLGRTLKDVMGDDYYATVKSRVDVALEGEPVRWERSATMHDARHRHLLVDYLPDVADDGTVRGLVLLTMDISEVKEAQQAQARVERQLRAIADNLPVLIGYIDREERYRFLNATAARMLSLNGAGGVGRTMAESMSEANYAQRREHIRAVLTGRRVDVDLASTLDGRLHHLQTVYIPDVQADGRIDGAYLLGTDVSALKQSEHQLRQMARVDALTGLPNRREFEERLSQAVARSTRDRRPIAVMFLDIDHFKQINDTWGHATGDLVLKEFATRLKHSVRTTDTPARLAGDEFVVLLEGLHAEADATLVAQKLVASVRNPFYLPGAELRVTTSVGVAYTERPRPNSDLMDFADQALYRAKSAGRDTFEVSTLGAYVTEFGGLAQLGEPHELEPATLSG